MLILVRTSDIQIRFAYPSDNQTEIQVKELTLKASWTVSYCRNIFFEKKDSSD